MIFLDTNVVVRMIVGTPLAHAEAAAALIDSRRSELYLAPLIMMEVAHTLRSFYGLSRSQIAMAMTEFVESLETAPDERRRMVQSLQLHQAKSVGLVDAWLAVESQSLGHQVASFDGDLRKCGANVADPMAA